MFYIRIRSFLRCPINISYALLMGGVTFNYLVTFSVFPCILTWIYLKKITQILIIKKAFWSIKKASPSFTLIKPIEFFVYMLIQLGVYSQFKVMPSRWLMPDRVIILHLSLLFLLMVFIFFLGRWLSSYHDELNLIYLILLFLFITIASFRFVKNFLILFLALEMIGVLYYFFFLIRLTANNLSALKYKNLLSNYLWISFFFLVLVSSIFYWLILNFGTLNFEQLNCLASESNEIWNFIVLIMLWKAGAPGFHFLKFELYQYLPIYTLIVFSLLSLFINSFLLEFIASNCWILLITNRLYFLLYVLFVNIILMLSALNAVSLYQFFGLSSLNTLTTMFMIFLI